MNQQFIKDVNQSVIWSGVERTVVLFSSDFCNAYWPEHQQMQFNEAIKHVSEKLGSNNYIIGPTDRGQKCVWYGIKDNPYKLFK